MCVCARAFSYTWTHLDKLKEIEVRSNPSLKRFQFYMDGVLRTESKYFLRNANKVYAEWDASAPASRTYTLCTVKEYVNGLLKLRIGTGMWGGFGGVEMETRALVGTSFVLIG